MSDLTRRSLLGGAAAMPLALWLQNCAPAPPGPGGPDPGPEPGPGPGPAPGGRVRYDARSPQGQAMLEIYARAVGQMQNAIAEGDPRGWVFQWYTHAVKATTTKAAEIARIYPQPSPWKTLAEQTWDTCEAHFPTSVEDYFLPWHRMYVYFFETIIRQVSGDDSFTLPYWNYSVADPALRGVIPPEFRQPGDPDFGPLFVDKRNPGVNDGRSIAQGQPGDPLSTASLAECFYSPEGATQGFNLRLDGGLHGNVHVLTGNRLNMGTIPWAAGDPVFWTHHCNIDRLWASWNAGGRTNPTTAAWLDKSFTFADAQGSGAHKTNGQVTDTALLGYSYDRLEPVPACPEADDAPRALPRTMARATPITLAAEPIRVTLGRPAEGAERSLDEGVREDGRLYVVARGLRAKAQPGVLYHLYLELPQGTSPAEGDAYHVGMLNFFDAGGHGTHAAGEGMRADKFHSFDVTELARKLQAEGKLGATPSLTFSPGGAPEADAGAVVSEVTLVEQ